MASSERLPHRDAQKNRCALSPGERAALSLLREEGWSFTTLAMVFEVHESSARRAYAPELGQSLQREAIRTEVFDR